jgi:hypothetical protein
LASFFKRIAKLKTFNRSAAGVGRIKLPIASKSSFNMDLCSHSIAKPLKI